MLRPIDIQNKEFEKKLKGYNCDEVDDFLDVVIQDYELLCKENQTLKDKIGLLTETVERYKQMENTMQKSIDIAKQAAEDAKRNAETEANAIISKAKLDASYLARQIDDEHMKRQLHSSVMTRFMQKSLISQPRLHPTSLEHSTTMHAMLSEPHFPISSRQEQIWTANSRLHRKP